MNVVVSDPKTGKAYQKKIEDPVYLNKKIGNEVDLSVIGLEGYKGVIKGGSDKDGFPMKASLEGVVRKKILIGQGTGFNKNQKKVVKKGDKKVKRAKYPAGVRVKKRVRGNTIAQDIHQINVVVTQQGQTPLEQIFPKAEKAATTEAK